MILKYFDSRFVYVVSSLHNKPIILIYFFCNVECPFSLLSLLIFRVVMSSNNVIFFQVFLGFSFSFIFLEFLTLLHIALSNLWLSPRFSQGFQCDFGFQICAFQWSSDSILTYSSVQMPCLFYPAGLLFGGPYFEFCLVIWFLDCFVFV